MSFEVLERTPEVTPLLVRLYDTHNLYTLAGNKGDDPATAELTTIMVDLLSIPLSDKEGELITDVLLALMKQAETDLRIALAEQLSLMGNAPLRMILSLANDDIRVADSVLRNSVVLQDLDLLYILQAKGVEHGRAMAHRKALSAPVIDALANTKDFEIAVNLSENNGLTLTHHAYEIFTKMAEDTPDLARPMLSRADLPQDIAQQIYSFIGDELKAVLVQRFGALAEQAADILDDLSLDMSGMRAFDEISSQEHMIALAQRQKEFGMLTLSSIISTLRRGQYATFFAQFSVYASLPFEVTKNLVKEPDGAGIAMICKAMGMMKADFMNLYLLTERFRKNARQMVTHSELGRIMSMYERMRGDEARRILDTKRH
ncbi:MAG: hypothetical protein DI626_09925 [Micavibrio aeruginosavorus]|uniref:DUF2336 domain-containing protein n=1 Tax=Micavibrio aeruginosavorus TaxID=349221 RepID=A0A2W4ZPL0_9BACT|nr:MAG: hypothetical protein DI626_09925 [Micavibrio aeruginosavorus]